MLMRKTQGVLPSEVASSIVNKKFITAKVKLSHSDVK